MKNILNYNRNMNSNIQGSRMMKCKINNNNKNYR